MTDIAINTFLKPIIDSSHSLHTVITSSYVRSNPMKKIEDASLLEIMGSIGSDMKILKTMKNIDITDLSGSTETLAE